MSCELEKARATKEARRAGIRLVLVTLECAVEQYRKALAQVDEDDAPSQVTKTLDAARSHLEDVARHLIEAKRA